MIDEEMSEATILVVDDNPTNLRLLFDYFKECGFKTLVATSGERAIQQLEQLQPNLILLDVMMPGIDGFETCRRLKQNEVTRDIPVIFMTALSDVGSKVTGFEVGAVDYVTKPFQQREVLARITTHLTISNLQRILQEQNAKLEEKNAQLEEALVNIKTLKGLLPICSNCKKIRDDEGYWQDVAVYVRDHTEAEFTHGICPDCMKKLYPEYYEDKE